MDSSKPAEIKLDLERFPLDPASSQHVYKGTIYPAITSPDHLANLKNLHIKHTDWIVAAYPKSGSTWMEEILYLISQDGDTRMSDTFCKTERNIGLEIKRSAEALNTLPDRHHVIKTHQMPDRLPSMAWDYNVKIVVVIRDPKDVAVSYYHYYRCVESVGYYSGGWDRFFDMFITGNVMFGSWFPWVKAWYDIAKCQPNIHVVSYKHLKQAPKECITRIANFLDKHLSDQVIETIVDHTSFNKMKSNPTMNRSELKNFNHDISPFMRKGIVGDWQTHFTSDQTKIFDMLYQQQMIGFEAVNDLF